MAFIITYYGTGMSPMKVQLPEYTTKEEAIRTAIELRADPRNGFSSLKEIKDIEIE